MAATRRLAAIMFTDIVGYTALTQTDEEGALKLLREQEELVRPLFAVHHGREIKSTGDGSLVEFESALRAVQCATDIQHHLQERNSQRGVTPIQLRIGIHLGDVEERGNDIFGDAVNIASRIQPLAPPGGVCISGEVFSQVRNKIPNELDKLGPQALKNVLLPVDIYQVVLPRTIKPTPSVSAGPTRLAVLPFANISPDPHDEYFADGLTEELISALSRIRDLRVIARTSVMRYKAGAKGISDIARELHVGTILEGSVRKAGDRLRIVAQLIDGRNEEHLWTETYDRVLTDVFAIQSDISNQVAMALRLGPQPALGRRDAPTANLEAYRAYLLGRSLWNRRSPDLLRSALQQFEGALKLDPAFASAHAGVADCYSVLTYRGHLRVAEGLPKAKEAATRALELDPALPEAHASLGLALRQELDWNSSEREYRKAIELNPMYSPAHLWYSMLLTAQGRVQEAVAELSLADDADPLSPTVSEVMGTQAWVDGRTSEAIAHWNRELELGGDPQVPQIYRTAVLLQMGRRSEANSSLETTGVPPTGLYGAAGPIIVHALLGDTRRARRELDDLIAPGKTEFVAPFQVAWVYAALGDVDQFYEWVFRNFDEIKGTNQGMTSLPLFARIREDPRYAHLLERLRLHRPAA